MVDEALTNPGHHLAALRVEPAASAGKTPAIGLDSTSEPGPSKPAAAPYALHPSRWMGWRIRLLVAAALLGCIGVFLLAQALAQSRHIDAEWRATASGDVELLASDEAALGALRGQRLVQVAGTGLGAIDIDVLALHPSARWLVDDAQRARHAALREALAAGLALERLTLVFADGRSLAIPTRVRGFDHVAPLFWLLSALAVAMYMVGVVVVLARPTQPNLLYLVMALCQAANLVFLAIESTLDLGTPWWYADLNPMLRPGLDLVAAAALLNALCLHPRRLPGAHWIAASAWAAAVALLVFGHTGELTNAWWWTQASVTLVGAVVIGLLTWSYRLEPHPSALVLRRFAFVTIATWLVLTLGLATSQSRPGIAHGIAVVGPLIWTVYISSLLMLVPYLSKSQKVMREFAILAAISTVATTLDLVLVTVFSLSQFASLTLSLFVSMAVYAGARQWIVDQMLGSSVLTTERMFEQLYRIARAVEAHPEHSAALLSGLLRDIFEPIEVAVVASESGSGTRVSGDGSAMLVPVPALVNSGTGSGSAVALRFAHRGRRLFTLEDARFTERIVEQLRRAVAYDEAVEQGRSEERMRLAQDLHDDIGARLLTLMYKAQSPEMEEYVRHTLQDLKTLTRGLAASSHRLSHASAEWKSDLTQRLTAAHVALRWSCQFDEDLLLSVVQWSALTRVLRELVSNVIAHSQAQCVGVDISLFRDSFDLNVSDDGVGRNPSAWAHGLGLGGVRKRVKQLGGSVEWREIRPRGIACRVTLRGLAERS